jgi:DNA polymerase III subunit epsilon
MSLPIYPWFDQVPPNLKTRNQLADQGLRPGGPVRGQVVWRQGKRWADLYEVAEAKPKRVPTEAQLAALKKAQVALRTCPSCGEDQGFVLPYRWRPGRDCGTCWRAMREGDLQDAARQARVWLRSSRTVILDSETTDLDGYLVQLAVIDTASTVLFDSLINPECLISEGAQRIHGITADQVASAPTWAQVEAEVLAVLGGRRVVVFNQEFDYNVLHNELMRRYGPGPMNWTTEVEHLAWDAADRAARTRAEALLRPRRWRCAMEVYAAWCGDWSEYHGSYRWQPLLGGDHTALGDCRATLAVLERMARGVEGEGEGDGE